MKVLLEGLLPRLFPGLVFLCISHEGKHDLEKSIPRKLKAWREPGVRFVVLRDNDGGDCIQTKERLRDLCAKGGRPEPTLIRLACQELEAWYFGAPDAVAAVFGPEYLNRIDGKARFRDPDAIPQPAQALVGIVAGFQKVSGARRMARALTSENRSSSFRVLMAGIDLLASEIRADNVSGEAADGHQ